MLLNYEIPYKENDLYPSITKHTAYSELLVKYTVNDSRVNIWLISVVYFRHFKIVLTRIWQKLLLMMVYAFGYYYNLMTDFPKGYVSHLT